MKILHLIRGGDSGGAKTHLFTLLDELKKYAECEVVCLIPGIFYQEILKKDVKTILFEQKNRFDLSVVAKIKDTIKKDGIDILHVHGAMANFVARFLKKQIDIPIVTTMHSDYLLDFDTFFKKIIFTSLNVWSLRKIDYFIAVSDNFKDMLISRGFRANGIHVVYNGMDFSKVPKHITPKEEFAKIHNIRLEENVTYIGIAARFDSVKGVDVFIEGAKKLYDKNKNVRFLIAGDGPQKEQLKALSDSLGMSDVIYFLGFLNDIYGFWNFIDINCLTSWCESFPYSMLEGAAMKKPMVASNVGGISGLIRDDETGYLFEAGNAEEFAKNLDKMCKDPERRKEMGENIYNLATTTFSSPTFAKTHIDIYQKILGDFRDKKRYDYIISGYYGYKNSGDDALLLAISNELKKQKNDVRIAVLSANPKETERLYRIDAINRFNIFKIIGALKKSKAMLSGGGSLMQDETSSKSLWYYACLLKASKKMGLKVMQISNGIGPINKKCNKNLVKKVINKYVDIITLREEKSLRELENMGVTTPKILTSDLAMTLEGSGIRDLKKVFESENIPQKDYVCISMRDWKNNPKCFEEEIAKVADYIYEKYNYGIIFIPMQYPLDLAISKRIAEKMKNPSNIISGHISTENVIGIIREAKVVLAMRLHSLIYGVSMNTPVVAIKYDPKIDGFMEYINLKHVLDVEKTDAAVLEKYCDECIERNDLSEDLCNKLKDKARENIDIAIELLK